MALLHCHNPQVQGEQLLHLAQLPPALSLFGTRANPPVSKSSPFPRPLGEITIITNNSHVPGPLDSQHGQQNTSHRQRPSGARRAVLPRARPEPRRTRPTCCPELHGSHGKHCLRAGASSVPQITANSQNNSQSTPALPLAGPCQEGSHHTRTPLPPRLHSFTDTGQLPRSPRHGKPSASSQGQLGSARPSKARGTQALLLLKGSGEQNSVCVLHGHMPGIK